MVKILVEKGANTNAHNIEGNTPIHEKPNIEIAKLSINNGANTSIKNYNEQKPEDYLNINKF